MITVDLHSHTFHSHAKDSAAAMCAAAMNKGMAIFGLSEHSLRPAGYTYPSDYQPRLEAGFPSYILEVQEQQQVCLGRMKVLLGLEMDYIPGQEAFAQDACNAYPYDYVIGGLHFQGHWGFDHSAADWADLSLDRCFEHFAQYYIDLEKMARCALFQIAAHPDLIKLFRVQAFHQWLEKPDAQPLVRAALTAMKETGMAMELSSAGLRKGLGEPYPGPVLMRIAAELDLPIAFGSDTHAVEHVAYAFDELAAYAQSFGYTESAWFSQRVIQMQSFV